ncbi:MAG: IPT/TIG domain-containing protein [Planctomycetes bacterium]|nr:IPT/TIG domain-containing protein [Planctomycetota bacterium]
MRTRLLILGLVLAGSTALSGAPTIQALLPSSGSAGDTVRIFGKDLAAAGVETAVTFGGVAADVVQARPWSIVTKVPDGLIPGANDVVVSVGDAQSDPATFTVFAPALPSIETIVPAEGYPGTPVKIIGANLGRLLSQVTVKFGEAEAAGWVWGNQVFTRVPDMPSGDVQLTVLVGGVASNPLPFRVKDLPAPVIGEIDPPSGRPGRIVAIHGDNFATPALRGSYVKVYFGVGASDATQAPILYRSLDLIAVIVPNIAPGMVTITVDVDGRVAEKPDAFEVTAPPPPVVASMSPTVGTPGMNVIITGKNLGTVVSNVEVAFYGGDGAEPVPATSVTPAFWGAVIFTTVPIGAKTGPVKVTVDGVEAAETPIFTVVDIPTPAITEIEPARGPAGTQVVIKGENLSAGTFLPKVTFAGVKAFAIYFPGWTWGTIHHDPMIAAIVPPTLAPGDVDVVVTVGGIASAPATFTVTPTP